MTSRLLIIPYKIYHKDDDNQPQIIPAAAAAHYYHNLHLISLAAEHLTNHRHQSALKHPTDIQPISLQPWILLGNNPEP